MTIELEQVAKRYRMEWIFRGLSFSFSPEHRYAITGHNGSGKSTLLRLLSGHLSPTKGRVRFSRQGKPLEADGLYRYVIYAAPYIELVEEYTMREILGFQQRFKPFASGLTTPAIIERLNLPKAADKEVRYFSSGMKQRLKLALAICADTPLLLLDEPTTNLDAEGAQWYRDLLADFGKDRLLVIASNVEADLADCDRSLHVPDYK